MAWQMFNVDMGWFVGRIKEPGVIRKIVLYLTAGNPKDPYKFRGIDCITGASVMSEKDAIIDKISGRVDALIGK